MRELEKLTKSSQSVNEDILKFVEDELDRYERPQNNGEAIIIMLKMYSILHVFRSTETDQPITHTWISSGLKKLMTNAREDSAISFQNNNDLAKHLLE